MQWAFDPKPWGMLKNHFNVELTYCGIQTVYHLKALIGTPQNTFLPKTFLSMMQFAIHAKPWGMLKKHLAIAAHVR